MESLEIILERYEGKPLSVKEKEALASEKNKYYQELLQSMAPEDVSEEVRNTLALLRKQELTLQYQDEWQRWASTLQLIMKRQT